MTYIVGFDFESFLIQPGILAPRAVCLSYATSIDHEVLHCNPKHQPDPCDTHDALEEMFRDAEIITGANTAFDAGVALANWPDLRDLIFKAYDEGRVRDVQINQMLIDIARGKFGGFVDGLNGKKARIGYSLADLSERFLGKDRHAQKSDPGAWRLRYSELWDVPVERFPKEAYDYSLEDSDDALALEEIQQAESSALLLDAGAQARAAFALHLMSARGIKTDPVAIERFRGIAEKEYDRCVKMLQTAGLVRSDGSRDTKAAKARMERVCAEKGIEPKLTDKEGISLDAEACEDSGDELLEAYAEATSLKTVVTSHIPALLLGTTTPIQARFNVLTETGRSSCSFSDKKTGFISPTNGYQLQNVRRLPGLRECFVPRAGYVFGDVDYAAQEMHTWAQVCLNLLGHSRLATLLNAGVDPHTDGAAAFLGIEYEEAKRRLKGLPKGDPLHDEMADMRQMQKAANFGNPAGLGPDKFVMYAKQSWGVIVTRARAVELKLKWLANLPEAQAYFDYIHGLCEDAGVATLQHLYSGRWRGLVPYTVACNSYFQGLAADASKAALYAVVRACYTGRNDLGEPSALEGSRVVNFVHDQILAEHPLSVAHEAVHEMRDIMVRVGSRYTPDVPLRAEPCLALCWSKDAEAEWVGEGRERRLKPWRPSFEAPSESGLYLLMML